jgi:ABC-type uncharacterized transport system permease subunit
MVANARHLFMQIPLTILACVVGSLVVVWAVSRVLDFAMNPSLVAVLSAVLSAAAIAAELRAKRKQAKSSAA